MLPAPDIGDPGVREGAAEEGADSLALHPSQVDGHPMPLREAEGGRVSLGRFRGERFWCRKMCPF